MFFSFYLDQALLVSDFGPRISMKIVDSLRDDILAGKLKSGNEIKVAAFICSGFRISFLSLICKIATCTSASI